MWLHGIVGLEYTITADNVKAISHKWLPHGLIKSVVVIRHAELYDSLVIFV